MTVARPFWHMEFSAYSGSLDSPASLLAKNADLQNQLIEANAKLSNIQAIQDDNDSLKSLLGRQTSSSTPSSVIRSTTKVVNGKKVTTTTADFLAAVLSKPPLAPYDEFILDIGNDYGVKVGDQIYAPGKILVGEISDVVGNTSKAKLFSSPGQKYNVIIGSSSIPTVSIGRGSGQYEAFLPNNSQISNGDFVYSPSLDDLPFGVVSDVSSDPTQTFETIYFAPSVNIFQLRWVIVRTNIEN
jgi:cell shape-determining protein MreC